MKKQSKTKSDSDYAGDEVVIQRKKKQAPVEDKRLSTAKKKLSTLQSGVSDLEAEIESLDLNGMGGPEAVFKAEYKRMLEYNAKLIRRMNQQLRENLTSRDIYALSTLMSQQREVIADLRTLVDMSEQAEMVQRQVLVPFVSDTTQLLTDVYFQLRKLITETSMPKQTQFALRQVEELVRQFGQGLQNSHNNSKEKLLQILLGEQQPEPKRKKRH